MQVFVDCDGVLADFDGHFQATFGVHPKVAEAEWGTADFWWGLRFAEGGFFRTMPMMPDAGELMATLWPLRPIILTACPRDGWAEVQKLQWAREHFPGVPMVCTHGPSSKPLYCREGDILVDDWNKYQDAWVAKGGHFIHYTSKRDTLEALHRLGVLKGE